MALTAKVVTFNIGTGAVASTVAVTGVGFQPTALILWWSGRTNSADAVGRRSIMSGVGFATGTSARNCATATSEDAVGTSDAYTAIYTDACVAAITVAGAVDGFADFQSFDADGFTLVIDDQFVTDIRVCALCIGGTDNALAANFTTTTTTGDKDITTIGFQGDAVLFASSNSSALTTISSSRAQVGLGFAVSSSQRFVAVFNTEGGAPNSDTYGYGLSAECVAMLDSTTGVPELRADFVSWLSNGFRINVIENADVANLNVICLVLKGGSWLVGNLLTQTDTVTDIVESGFGFTPVGTLFASCCRAESTQDASTAHAELSIGAFNSISSRAAQTILDEDGVGTMETTTAVEFDEVYANISLTSTIDGLMDIKSVDADGFTCVHGGEFVYLADGRRVRMSEMVNSRHPGPVLSLARDGSLVPRRVTNWYQFPRNGKRWAFVSHEHAGLRPGNGRHKRGVWVTDDHPFLTTHGYRRVAELNGNDRFILAQSAMTEPQREAATGLILGDGHITTGRAGHYLRLLHCLQQADYLNLLHRFFGSLSGKVAANTARNRVAFQTRSTAEWAAWRMRWYPDGRKQVPADFSIHELSNRVLASWYMDDGSLGKGGRNRPAYAAILCTEGFPKLDVDRLAAVLSLLGYEITLQPAQNKSARIRITAAASSEFFTRIAPYVPPVLRYKLPPKIALNYAYDPALWDAPQRQLTASARPIVEFHDKQHWKRGYEQFVYCLDVEETHNFICGDLILHNCIMDDADPAQSFVGYLAFGNVASVAELPPMPFPIKRFMMTGL